MTNRKKTTVSVSLVKLLRAYAARFKINFKAVMASAGLEPAILEDGEARIPGVAFDTMWQHIAEASDDPNPGLSFGRQIGDNYPGGSLLFTMMLNCETIGKALDVFVRYHRIMADVIQPKFEKSGKSAVLSWEIPLYGLQSHSHLSEVLLCIYHSILQTLSQGKLIPEKVCFTHGAPGDTREYARIFKAPVKFSEKNNELVINYRDLDIAIHLANPSLYELLEKQAGKIFHDLDNRKEWSSKVLQQLTHMILKGMTPKIDTVAGELALSRRSLQEKLKTEKTGFRCLLETVRKQIALEQLAVQDTRICDVAFLLGYSDQSAFNHAFKRWTGKTPKAFCREFA